MQTGLSLWWFLLSTLLLPLWCRILLCIPMSKFYLFIFCLFSGEGKEVHASTGQLKAQRRGKGLHVQQICFCYLQHRVKVCVWLEACAFSYVPVWWVNAWVRKGSSVLVTCSMKLLWYFTRVDMLEEEREEMSEWRFALPPTSSIQLCHRNQKGYPAGTGADAVFFFLLSKYMPGFWGQSWVLGLLSLWVWNRLRRTERQRENIRGKRESV